MDNNKKDFKMDEIDIQIISLIQKDQNLTHSEIAEKINRSQPTVGMRIKKLKKAGILQFQPGINFKNVDFNLVEVNLKTKDPEEIMDMARSCPFMLNAFKLSGKYNISVLLVSRKIEKLYAVVNNHFRNNSKVQKVTMDIITEIAKDYVLPMSLETEYLTPESKDGCSGECKYCKYKE